jgi:hypothetical protein
MFLQKIKQGTKMRATYEEHNLALQTCAKIRAAFPKFNYPLTVGTPEADADEQLIALNELCLSHTANQPCRMYHKALDAISIWAGVQIGDKLPDAVFEIESQDNDAVVCKTASGRRYALSAGKQGWLRGHQFGATIADAMRGAA